MKINPEILAISNTLYYLCYVLTMGRGLQPHKTLTTMMNTGSIFAVKVFHSQRTETVNFDSYEAADELVQEMGERNIKTRAYELRDGKTLDMYTEEDVMTDEYMNQENA